jgi:hypothetical protein
MKAIGKDMQAWSLDELINQEIAPQGTVERAAFDAKVEAKIRQQEQYTSMRIQMPVYMRDAIRRNAQALGESASTYVNNIFSQVISPMVI